MNGTKSFGIVYCGFRGNIRLIGPVLTQAQRLFSGCGQQGIHQRWLGNGVQHDGTGYSQRDLLATGVVLTAKRLDRINQAFSSFSTGYKDGGIAPRAVNSISEF